MIYLIALPALAAIFYQTRQLEMPFAFSTAVFGGLFLAIWMSGIVLPGADVLVALCLTLAITTFAHLRQEAWIDRIVSAGLGENDAAAATDQTNDGLVETHPAKQFCTRLTHDFAVSGKHSVFAVRLINTEEYEDFLAAIADMSVRQREGFYADLNYSSISERAVATFTEQHHDSIDAHLLMGHVQLCKAKRLGLKPGLIQDENMAAAISEAFRYFRLAQRIDHSDAEVYCGLLLAKTFAGLRAEHIEKSLGDLLNCGGIHVHGLLVAGRALVQDGDSANRFVNLVTTQKDATDSLALTAEPNDCHETTSLARVEFSRLLTHLECALLYNNAAVKGDLPWIRELQKSIDLVSTHIDGQWQTAIAQNLIASVLQITGDYRQSNVFLKQIEKTVSPYPWQCLASIASAPATNGVTRTKGVLAC